MPVIIPELAVKFLPTVNLPDKWYMAVALTFNKYTIHSQYWTLSVISPALHKNTFCQDRVIKTRIVRLRWPYDMRSSVRAEKYGCPYCVPKSTSVTLAVDEKTLPIATITGRTDRQTECDAICGPLLGRRAA